MPVTVIVEPSGATPAAIERWKTAAQLAADEYSSQVELKSTDPETGAVLSHLVADPFSCDWCPGDGRGDHALDCAKRQ